MTSADLHIERAQRDGARKLARTLLAASRGADDALASMDSPAVRYNVERVCGMHHARSATTWGFVAEILDDMAFALRVFEPVR